MTGILGQLKWESLKKRRKDNKLILLYLNDLPGLQISPLELSDDSVSKFTSLVRAWGRTGAVVRASDFGPRGPWFDSWPLLSLLWP